jgi:hypothetical protein
LSSELELFLLVVLFYLYDSSVLLHSNEAILTRESADRWAASVGWSGFVFAGRVLCMLNPFTPHRPAFRLHWNFDSLVVDTADRSWTESAATLKGLMPFTLAAGVGLFVLLPLGLFTPLSVYADVAGMALFYIATAFALYRVKRSRMLATTGLKRFVGFSFECLACPPFGVNMVRRISLIQRVPEPLPLAGARLLDASSWDQLKSRCVARLDEALRITAEESIESRSLEAQKQRIRELVSRP